MTERRTTDYSRSRAILIGTSAYTHLRPVDAAANSLASMSRLLTGPQCGWQPDRVTVLLDERKPGDIPDQLVEQYCDATDIALFYYVGHGQIDFRDELCLGLVDSRTQTERIATTSLTFDAVRSALTMSDAKVKIVILDCCFAGLAVGRDGTLSASPDLIGLTGGTGAYILAASGAYNSAWFEQEGPAPMTYFTKHLTEIVDEGIAGEPEGLNLSTIYRHLEHRLAQARKPLPKRRVIGTADNFIFAVNRAYTPEHDATSLSGARRFDLRGLYMDDIYSDPRVREEDARTANARLHSTETLAEAAKIFMAGGGRTVDPDEPSDPQPPPPPAPERPMMRSLQSSAPALPQRPGPFGSPEGIIAAARWQRLTELVAEVDGLRLAGKDYSANEVLLEVGTHRSPVVIVAAVRALHTLERDTDVVTVLGGVGCERPAAVVVEVVQGLQSAGLPDFADTLLAVVGANASAGSVIATVEALRGMALWEDSKVVLAAVRWNKADVASTVQRVIS
ncbi:caspase family protein [Dactylosporangium sp. NPDC051485]|uniref:caspase family protein n=1 Tax=Dactylosporangium sp. NPDC051485 TaxID=3154846 RepID=UPI003413538C